MGFCIPFLYGTLNPYYCLFLTLRSGMGSWFVAKIYSFQQFYTKNFPPRLRFKRERERERHVISTHEDDIYSIYFYVKILKPHPNRGYFLPLEDHDANTSTIEKYCIKNNVILNYLVVAKMDYVILDRDIGSTRCYIYLNSGNSCGIWR